MVDRDIEERLQLVLVKVDRDHAVGAGRGDEVRQQLRADGDARLVLPVLARVAVIGNDRRHPRRRGTRRCIDQQEQLHDVLGRRVGGLDDEHIAPPDVLVDTDEDLAVREALDRHIAERAAELPGDRLGERPICGPREEHHLPAHGIDY